MGKKTLYAAVLLTCLLLCTGAKGQGLSLDLPDTVRPYQPAEIAVEAPRPGQLTIQLRSEAGPELPLCENLPVEAGRNTLRWNATSYGGMPLRAGRYHLLARLTDEDGGHSTAHAFVTAERAAAALIYALPSGETLYHRRTEPWFVDCAVTGAGVVHLECYADESLTQRFASIRKKLEGSGRFRIAWNGACDGRKALAGQYWMRAYLDGREEEAFVFPLEIRDGSEPVPELAPTGPLLPDIRSDENLWKAILAPAAVVDIGAEEHQRLYLSPDPDSDVVGQVHGQSQAVEVVEPGARYTLVRAWRHEDGAYVEGYVPTKKLKMVLPGTRYGVVIDKTAQTLTVYEAGKPVGRARVSTGLKAPGREFRETRAGAFLTTDRLVSFDSGGYRCDYPIRIDGGNLLHQVGYQERADGMADFSDQASRLGQRASEGCVRVDWRTDDEYTINAYWLWTHLPWRTKVLVLP